MEQIKKIHTILFVNNQDDSTKFYSSLLRNQPVLHVKGMTEFELAKNLILGLMPNDGIVKITGNFTPHPASGNGIPRCELYLYVNDIVLEFENALHCNAKLISPISERDWGDKTCYFADPDGHIIAFAEKIKKSDDSY